jgi:hypothetical protein
MTEGGERKTCVRSPIVVEPAIETCETSHALT